MGRQTQDAEHKKRVGFSHRPVFMSGHGVSALKDAETLVKKRLFCRAGMDRNGVHIPAIRAATMTSKKRFIRQFLQSERPGQPLPHAPRQERRGAVEHISKPNLCGTAPETSP
ncbi:hypothetical protein [Aliiroseovarius zhejiangensis]|uniref:hypothetical protein n=1 Tax=Aliiroseovarius zhejiangensis TaxID=1632025 RepID=UPI00174B9D12|nr:hypothetical protein [Aliiroseovarius zhejiangensis]